MPPELGKEREIWLNNKQHQQNEDKGMHVIKTINPDSPGALRFQRVWGDKLVAVRYRKPAAE